MKKTLLALAILGGFATAASAQTNVTIYGVVDVAVSHYNTNSGFGHGSGTFMEDGGDWNGLNGSRLGFKGTEDLGGGLSALFNIEGGFRTDEGTSTQGSTLFGRRSVVGLSSKTLGTVTLGRQDALSFEALGTIDPFGAGSVGAAYGGLTGGAGPGFFYGGRLTNSVSYKTADISGLTLGAQYAFGEVPGAFSLGSGFDVSATYANGPLTVVADYTSGSNCGAFFLGGRGGSYGGCAVGGTKTDIKGWFVGGMYDFSVVKLHAAVGGSKLDQPGVTLTDDRTYLLGATVPFGDSLSLLASWVRDEGRSAAQGDGKADQYALGAIYNLSKRTYAYTAASYTKNTITGAASAPDRGVAYQVGLGHMF